MGDPVTTMGVMVAVGATSGAGKAYFQRKSELSQLDALDLKREQTELQYQQKTLSNFELTNKILDSQISEASARGISMYSPSLEAIQRSTLNTGAKNQKNFDTEESIFERNIKIEKRNVRDTFVGQLFGDAAKFTKSIAGAVGNMPTGVGS